MTQVAKTQEQQFTALLDSELNCLQVLLETLHREFDALSQSDVEALEQVTLDKNNALANQAAATLARQQFVTASACENADKGLQQLIASFDNRASLSATFNQLRALAEQCQSANRANGRMITQKQQYTRNALDILRQADSKPSTYSDQGDTVTQSESRILGKA